MRGRVRERARRARTRAYVHARAPVPLHPLHPRQEDEGIGKFRGEGLVTVARVEVNGRGNGIGSA
jgi:hypothetical protein